MRKYKRNKYDEYNKPFGLYLPDIINHKYKYIVEIDGSIHSLPEAIKHDRKKDKYYNQQGYKCIRVIAHSEESFKRCITILHILTSIPLKGLPSFKTQEEIDDWMNK